MQHISIHRYTIMTGLSAAAPPILASTLLDSSLQKNSNDSSVHERCGMVESDPWDLTRDIEEGVSLMPGRSVLSCGSVIGISGLQPTNTNGSREGTGDDIRYWVEEVGAHFLLTFSPFFCFLVAVYRLVK